MTDPCADYFAAAGMYVFDSVSRVAWRELFTDFGSVLRRQGHDIGACADHPLEVRYGCDDAIYQSDAMLIAHTCGYPLVTRLVHSHYPVSVPVFNIQGCAGRNYSSWFVCHQSNPGQSLEAFKNSRVAINSRDSNSGMNVLRHAISELQNARDNTAIFFDSVIETGSHEASLNLVAEGEADMAAIDAVSHYHLLRLDPGLEQKTRVFAQSRHTPGLPFIMRRDTSTRLIAFDSVAALSSTITKALNLCLQELDPTLQDALKLHQFEAVTTDDYLQILALEEAAKVRGYSKIA